ncbi:ROK family protein [Paenibacillus eucommiae]|uniref:NBD/HSP70 family sugar kinase n=1 Tax=Paenibacillus eucommiae TaxID=1355755 RepID=A0ABS4J951_9BACL|nr:ROK family protein [Paenibacillus eucommiae]MBP1995606.1 putative NBD/HSP70 family sugar kinase [Paenibacillus eucommiae]
MIKLMEGIPINSNKIAYLQQVKQQNMAAILKQIWKYEQVSRVELVDHTSLTSGTITNLTHELIELRVIREYASVSGNVGRKRVLLGFDPDYYRILGLDIGRSTFEITVTDLCGRILKTVGREIADQQGPDVYFREIEPVLAEIKEQIEQAGHQILGLGVGVPGPIDYGKGALLNPPNFPGWGGFELQQTLNERFQLLTLIEDDARTSALAERWYGIGRNVEDLVFITMGIGIGGGVISKGEIVRGTNGLCGQVGHMTIVMEGKVCDCGNRGCWEPIGSIPGILSRWSEGSTMDAFKAAVDRGEPEALKCLEDTLIYLETALINVFNLYDPELVVLGGRLFPYLAPSISSVQSRLQSRLYAFAKDRLRLEPSTFGASQSAVGATALLFRYLLNEPVKLLIER